MTKWKSGFAALAFFLPSACSAEAPGVEATRNPDKGWILAKSIERPKTHYVIVLPNRWDQPAVYRDAVRTLCRPREFCQVNFWKDPDMVPDAYPPGREQIRAQIPVAASYTREGRIRVGFMCRFNPGQCPSNADPETIE